MPNPTKKSSNSDFNTYFDALKKYVETAYSTRAERFAYLVESPENSELTLSDISLVQVLEQIFETPVRDLDTELRNAGYFWKIYTDFHNIHFTDPDVQNETSSVESAKTYIENPPLVFPKALSELESEDYQDLAHFLFKAFHPLDFPLMEKFIAIKGEDGVEDSVEAFINCNLLQSENSTFDFETNIFNKGEDLKTLCASDTDNPLLLHYVLGLVETVEDKDKKKKKINEDFLPSIALPESFSALPSDPKTDSFDIKGVWLLANPGYGEDLAKVVQKNKDVKPELEHTALKDQYYLWHCLRQTPNETLYLPWDGTKLDYEQVPELSKTKPEETTQPGWYRKKSTDLWDAGWKKYQLMRMEAFPYRSFDSKSFDGILETLAKQKCFLPSLVVNIRVLVALLTINKDQESNTKKIGPVFFPRNIERWCDLLRATIPILKQNEIQNRYQANNFSSETESMDFEALETILLSHSSFGKSSNVANISYGNRSIPIALLEKQLRSITENAPANKDISTIANLRKILEARRKAIPFPEDTKTFSQKCEFYLTYPRMKRLHFSYGTDSSDEEVAASFAALEALHSLMLKYTKDHNGTAYPIPSYYEKECRKVKTQDQAKTYWTKIHSLQKEVVKTLLLEYIPLEDGE
ncbi:hypothetical protein BK816_06255 [Boudabousia tangfeifanii]|uniref:Uncharacterized protein n=1 Tax=Boudabousia tangfeifanii TaxID=1912795 RepID=A0A1D9MKX5_9ACTO|nr:hypothetical protein [Boudabousia tangfeifanii]AOZ72942.1 hypothetical protein BK816_06255 [Boudabousia tangfeifanii]